MLFESFSSQLSVSKHLITVPPTISNSKITTANTNLRAKDTGSKRLGTKKYAGFNINSPKQLLEKFETVLGFTPLNNESKPSASRQSLRKYAADHKIVQTYLEWKKQSRSCSPCRYILCPT